MSLWHLGLFIFTVHIIYALVYFFIRKHRKYLPGLLHFIFTELFFIYIILSPFVFDGQLARRYYAGESWMAEFPALFAGSIPVIFVLVLAGNFLFLGNIVYAIARSLKK